MWQSKFHIHTKQLAELWFCIFQLLHSYTAGGKTKTLNRIVANIPRI
jgi:hypothetical protein